VWTAAAVVASAVCSVRSGAVYGLRVHYPHLQTRTSVSTRHLEAGTASYISPGCFVGEGVNEKVDVSSAGHAAVGVCGGGAPWKGHNMMQVAYQVRSVMTVTVTVTATVTVTVTVTATVAVAITVTMTVTVAVTVTAGGMPGEAWWSRGATVWST